MKRRTRRILQVTLFLATMGWVYTGCRTAAPRTEVSQEESIAMSESSTPSSQPSKMEAPAARPGNHPLLPYKRYELDNGLRVIVKEVHSAPIVAVDIWVGTGAADEHPDEIGISHFLEHMFFKGTEKRPAGQMDLEIKGLGGYNNAATSYDYTHYYVVLPSEHYLKALDILSDAVLNSTFPPEEIEREREVVLREIDRKEDSPWGKLFTEFLERTFADNPYGRPILGTAESLASIDHDAFKRYVGRAYRPSNLVVAIVGDVDTEKALESVREIFGKIPGEKHVATAPFDIQPPAQPVTFTIERTCKELCGGGLSHCRAARTAGGIRAGLAASILARAAVVALPILKEDKGLVTDASSFYWTLERAGCSAWKPPARWRFARGGKILFEQIERLRREISATPRSKRRKARSSAISLSVPRRRPILRERWANSKSPRALTTRCIIPTASGR